MKHKPELWMPMIETADTVAGRYGISRKAQDEYALISEQRTAAAQDARRFDDEIVPLASVKQVTDFLFTERTIEYNRIVAIEYPRRGIWSLGFVTGESMLEMTAKEYYEQQEEDAEEGGKNED